MAMLAPRAPPLAVGEVNAPSLGESLASLPTPALVLDVDAADSNAARAAVALTVLHGGRSAPLALRPHVKSHKCAELAARQLSLTERAAAAAAAAAGSGAPPIFAAGVCAQKVSEAEAMVAGGIADVLISNEIVEPRALARVAALASGGSPFRSPSGALPAIGIVVDDAEATHSLSEAAVAAGATIRVLVEIDAGQRRCGVPDVPSAVELGRLVSTLPGLRLDGIQA
jgi:D-threonine aldolase